MLWHNITAYAERAEAEKDPKKNLFNCAQRVHQVKNLVKLLSSLEASCFLWNVCLKIYTTFFFLFFLNRIPLNCSQSIIPSYWSVASNTPCMLLMLVLSSWSAVPYIPLVILPVNPKNVFVEVSTPLVSWPFWVWQVAHSTNLFYNKIKQIYSC